jgi:cytochrome c-type biogenesis protein CcmE
MTSESRNTFAEGSEMGSDSPATEPIVRRRNRTNTRFFAAGGVLVIAIAFLIFNGMQGTSAFYMTVDELHKSTAVTDGKQIRVGGDVVEGTIQRGGIGEEIRFEITDGISTVSIVYNGPAPDIFSDHAEVIATGTMADDGTFHATELLTKCPSRFDTAEDKT